jgi:DNA-binding MarR family transcriptional regulator
MARSSSPSAAGANGDAPPPLQVPVGLGVSLRQAWLGYQLQLDEAMADAGFGKRRFPDGRVLRLCSEPPGSTISGIGRVLGITRQGATKVVSHLRDLGFVSVADSATSGREKCVSLTPLGVEYLAAQRKAAGEIERQLRSELGDAPFVALYSLLGALGEGERVRMRAYLQRSDSDRANRDSAGKSYRSQS